jgi:purine-binding chemotaxis protein CheW
MTNSEPDHVEAGLQETPTHRWLLVRVGERVVALPAADILEITDPQPLTRLPGWPKVVLGLMNHRGTPVTVLDMGIRAGGKPTTRKTGYRIVLVNWREYRIGLAVDDALAFAEDPATQSEEPVSTVSLDAILDPIF